MKLPVAVAVLLPALAFAQQPPQQPQPSAQFCGQLATMLATAVDERGALLAKVEDLTKQLEAAKAAKETPKP